MQEGFAKENLTITIHKPPRGLAEAIKREANIRGLSVGRYVCRILVKECMKHGKKTV